MTALDGIIFAGLTLALVFAVAALRKQHQYMSRPIRNPCVALSLVGIIVMVCALIAR